MTDPQENLTAEQVDEIRRQQTASDDRFMRRFIVLIILAFVAGLAFLAVCLYMVVKNSPG